MDKTGEGVPNLGKILDGLDVMNMSGKNLLEPNVDEALRISPLKEVALSDRNDRSLRSLNNSAVSEKNNRSLRSRDDSGVSDRNSRSLRNGNRSVNKSNSGVLDKSNRSLRSGNKPAVEKELNSSGKTGEKRSSAAKELFSDSSSGKDTSGNNLDGSQKLLDGSEQPLGLQEDEEVDGSGRDVQANVSNANSQTEKNVDKELKNGDEDLMNILLASLRNRMREEADRSKVEDNGSKENGQRGEDINVSQVVGLKESSKSGDDIVNDTQRGERRRGKRGREDVNKSVTPEEENENRDRDVSMDVINGSQRDEGEVGNRSLRYRID
ncbi:uncharacterized protein LOC120355199 [Nilaparvata lugens]|uniref:uncharacterized protein LOC120355199 n=1 Tax=Nilaparvata lugens TaxID=108931 RepID=UPI00193D1BE0|nr:uncharacterized protein LOC120355199 [Nilaparvata lugens]